MAKSPGPGRCVHCLGSFNKRNWDHVFPKSWYPDTTTRNLQKWQIPTCKPCNDRYGKLEGDLLIRLGLCIDPGARATSGIVDKTLRAFDPSYARNEKDKRLRNAKRERILREAITGDRIPGDSLYPNFEEKWGRPPEKQIAIRIPAESIRSLTEKIVRGIFFIEDGLYIEPPYAVKSYALRDEATEPITQMLSKFGTAYAREPGISVTRAVTPEDGISSIFEIVIWGQLKMYASVTKADV